MFCCAHGGGPRCQSDVDGGEVCGKPAIYAGDGTPATACCAHGGGPRRKRVIDAKYSCGTSASCGDRVQVVHAGGTFDGLSGEVVSLSRCFAVVQFDPDCEAANVWRGYAGSKERKGLMHLRLLPSAAAAV